VQAVDGGWWFENGRYDETFCLRAEVKGSVAAYRRAAPGDTPTMRLKARLNAASDW
jgi:hypothetical protein